MNSRTWQCPPPASSRDPPTCQTSDGMRHVATPLAGEHFTKRASAMGPPTHYKCPYGRACIRRSACLPACLPACVRACLRASSVFFVFFSPFSFRFPLTASATREREASLSAGETSASPKVGFKGSAEEGKGCGEGRGERGGRR